jgi:DNA uptake protein ComE-like DNA-binding protein
MDARANRLVIRYGLGKAQAEALVAAGYDLPAKIKAASKSDLEKVKGIGVATAEKLKG